MMGLGEITLDDYLDGREIKYPITDEQLESAVDFVNKLNELEKLYGKILVITSGYRPWEMDVGIPGAKFDDAHTKCAAADIRDRDGALYTWCVGHLETLVKLGFWMESQHSALTHVHLQSCPPKSGNRIFVG